MINPLLKTFIAVVDNGSFTKASEALFISATAVMKQMNLLEAHIGLPLLKRTHHGIILTEAGQSIYDDAKFITHYSEQAIGRAYSRQLTENYTIRLGSSMLYPAKELVQLWNRVSSSYPQFKLRIVPFDDSGKNAELDSIGETMDIVAGAFGRKDAPGFHFLKLNEYHFSIAMPISHPLSSKKKLTYEDLFGEHLMIMPRGNSLMNDQIRDDIEDLNKEKEHSSIILEDAPAHYDINTFNSCDEKGFLLLTLDGWKDIHPSLATIPLKVSYTLPYGIISSENSNEATKLFLNIVRQIYTNS